MVTPLVGFKIQGIHRYPIQPKNNTHMQITSLPPPFTQLTPPPLTYSLICLSFFPSLPPPFIYLLPTSLPSSFLYIIGSVSVTLDPFAKATRDERLFVADVPPGYSLLLNKFNSLDEHVSSPCSVTLCLCQCCAISYHDVLYVITLNSTVQHYTVRMPSLYYIMLHYSLYCIMLHYSLYCIMLHYSALSGESSRTELRVVQ